MSNAPISIPGLNIDSFIRVIQSPYDTQEVFNLIRTMVTADNFKNVSAAYNKAIEGDVELQRLYGEHYAPRLPTTAELTGCPPGSLGKLLADHLIKNNITLDFEGIDQAKIYDTQEGFLDYVRLRSRRLHDLLHVLLGCDTSPIGEGRVAAFQAAQYAGSFQALIVSFITTHIIFYESDNLPKWLKAMNQAFEVGANAQPFYGIAWEEYFNENIDVLRKRYAMPDLGAH